jgi:hypothetical protein
MFDHPIGVNVSQIGVTNNDEYAFKDLMKCSLPFFIAEEWNGEDPDIDLNKLADLEDFDSNRYPNVAPESGEVYRTVIGLNTDGTYAEAGQYYLLYEGAGTIRIYGDTDDDTITGTGDMTPNEFTLSPSATGLYLDIENTSATGISKIVIIPKREYSFSCYLKRPFDGKFKERYTHFRCIRFLNWSVPTNDSLPFTDLTWGSRPTKDSQTYSVEYLGTPWEEIIELCNSMEIDPWICVHHLSHIDPTYYTNLATLFRDNLDPSLTLTIEYSNDTWVVGTPQYNYLLAQANARGIPGAQEQTRVASLYGERSAELFIRFTQVFGGDTRLNFAVATSVFLGENNLFKRMTPNPAVPTTILSAGYIRQQAGVSGTGVTNTVINIAVDPQVGRWLTDDQDPDFSLIFPGVSTIEQWGNLILDNQLRTFGSEISYNLISGSAPTRTGSLPVILAFAQPRNYSISFINGPIFLNPKNGVASSSTIKNLFSNYLQSSLAGELMTDLLELQRSRVQNAGLTLKYMIADKFTGVYDGLDNSFLASKFRGTGNPYKESRISSLVNWINDFFG